MENQTELKWYQKPVGVIILLIFFFPVGLYLMWKNELWTKQTRWIVTGVLALGVIANAGNDKNSNNNSGGTTICECHKAYLDNVNAAIYSGSGASTSKVDKCLIYFTEREMIYADETHGCVSGD
jgi:hypothetical protein